MRKMIMIDEPRDCCGCGVCSEVCPVKAINMGQDKYGFVVPKIIKDKCISCGKCRKVCPCINKYSVPDYEQIAYAAYSSNPEVRFNGSSGGAFETLAREILRQDGVAYGAAFDSRMSLKMERVNDVAGLQTLLKSKYIQSDCSEAYKQIQDDLKAGRIVLVCSTPCQIGALRNYLGIDYEKFITIDFFCTGVPSQEFFNKCKSHVERKNNIKIIDYQFRTKIKNGATPCYYKLTYEKNGKTTSKTRLYLKSPYYMAFQKYISLRDSCYFCKYADSNRASDITIGDFHSINSYVKEINRFDGCSTIIINSVKGALLFEQCSKEFEIWKMNLEQMKSNKDCFAGPTAEPAGRTQFLTDYCTMNFGDFADKYMNSSKEWKKEVYYRLPSGIRKIIKRIVIGE